MKADTSSSLLGVRPGVNHEELKDAWRRFALTHHPDRGGQPDFFRAGAEEYRRLSGQRSRLCGSEVVFYRKPKGLQVPVSWCRKRWRARRRPRRVI
ncbi:MAG: hypothetical protein H0T12_01885 [Actinobacteria bacterium]|nr:hypothetical protein [Actinomycetota bacterium]